MMKQLLIMLLAIAIVGCKDEPEKPKDYATLSGKIINKTSDSLKLANRNFSKNIAVNADGTFKDTLKLEPGIYYISNGVESTPIFLKNGYDINLSVDTQNFDKSLVYSGEGSENSNFLAKHISLQTDLFENLDELNETNIDSTFDNIRKELSEFYDSNKSIDTMIINQMTADLDPTLKIYKNYYVERIALKKEFPAGMPSPTFNYENYKGGTTDLKDLKGKYVYVDVWATWCGPCKAEIPALKKVESDYHDKNIEFVSISVDRKKDYETWKKMVKDKELGGIQLYADNDWNSEFVKNYKIKGIPRFILIDPNGNIVSPDAPRPSDPKLIEMFNELKI